MSVTFGPIIEYSFDKDKSIRSQKDKKLVLLEIQKTMSNITDWSTWVQEIRNKELYEGEFDSIIGKVHRMITINGPRNGELEDHGEVDEKLRLAKKMANINKKLQTHFKTPKYNKIENTLPVFWI